MTSEADEASGVTRVDRSWRLSSLLDLLAEHRRLSVAEASAALGVSEATIRRDFNTLAKQQLVSRTHGGVVATSVAYELPVRYRSGPEDAKERIADVAAQLVKPGDVVGFNEGTTTSATARRLAVRGELGASELRPALTVVTNALNIATEMVLRPYIRTVTLGGVARPQSYELTGPLAALVLQEFWVDRLFLGVDGFTLDGGTSCFHEGEAAINAMMVQRASQVTVVAGAEKLGRRTFARICDARSVTMLITDSSADAKYVETVRATGIDVVLV